MNDNSSIDLDSKICWFCKKGRHKDCMKEIPIEGNQEGPHDCTFDTKIVICKCNH